jgi:hypothetical protein
MNEREASYGRERLSVSRRFMTSEKELAVRSEEEYVRSAEARRRRKP